MTLRLDPPRAVGALRVAALCEYGAGAYIWAGATFFSGSKHPLAILVLRGRQLDAFDLEGSPLDLAELEKRCPDLRNDMLKAR